jgi:putative spermidine/putrescine transport system ATP-binding protein
MARPMMHKLRLIEVGKRYGDVVALRPTSLDVRIGEFLTLLGPSGSGKTTLLQSIAGISAFDQGEVWIDGVSAAKQPPHRRDIGMIFQNYALFPHLSVAENVAFPLNMRRVPAAEVRRRVREVLEVVKLAHTADRFPSELSGGQQQRIALARCAVYQPSVVLMDEPLGALDKGLREEMQLEIRRIHRELGTTIIYVTHDQEEAMAMSDRICLMRDGRIEQIGTPAELYFAPRTVFAAQFLGNSNILTGRVVRQENGHNVVALRAGGEVSVRPRDRTPALGTMVDVMVRAEAVKDGDLTGLASIVEATVDDSVLVGSISRTRWRLADGTGMTQAALTAPGLELRRIGERARIGWDIACAVLLERD